MNFQVIYEDNHLIAVNKPGGMLVQGDITGDTPLLDLVKNYIKVRYQKPGDVFLGTIHRLDRPVSGVVIFARTSKALTRMNQIFQERDIQKLYLAITENRPDPLSGTITDYLKKDAEKNVVKRFPNPSKRPSDAKLSVLDYELMAEIGDNHLLKVNPHTGRPHQIRVQLAGIGCPIRGDLKYGAPKANKNGTIHLHCYKLSFIHPVKNEEVEIIADLPKDNIWNLFSAFVQ
jgi:23S rRNA pseudouridine1911/1915/1917 synthase